jgi:hypothetical protein
VSIPLRRAARETRRSSRVQWLQYFDPQCRKKPRKKNRAEGLSTSRVPHGRPYSNRQDTLLASGDQSDPSRTADRAQDRGPFSALAAAARSKVQRLCRRASRLCLPWISRNWVLRPALASAAKRARQVCEPTFSSSRYCDPLSSQRLYVLFLLSPL